MAMELTAQAVMTGAQMLVEVLRREQVDVVFGYPGGAVLPLYDALFQSGIAHVLARHEQGAIHMAEGYARVSGRPGVVIVTSGPGATNIVTGLADAMSDSLPIVAITGQVATGVIGSDAFQETSIIGICTPITKHCEQVRDVRELARALKEAFHIATTGRKGPVLVDIPKDVAGASSVFDYPPAVVLPGYQPNLSAHPLQIARLREALAASERPVVLVGAGVLHAGAHETFAAWVQREQIPVVSTLLGLGAYPAGADGFLGMGGMHGSYAANQALSNCDLLINIGARFDDRLTGNTALFAPHAVVAHIDIDPSEIGKNIRTHIGIVADAAHALEALLQQPACGGDHAAWCAHLQGLQQSFPFWYGQSTGALKPQRVLERIYELTGGSAIVVTDVGQHQMWAAQFCPRHQPGDWVTSGGLGTMGFGLPAAIGAQLARRDARVVAVVGDAGFQMTLQELAVVVTLKLPIKIVIINNRSLGMVRQWQELFYDQRYSESLMPQQPDWCKLAQAYGMLGAVVADERDLSMELPRLLASPDPVLIDCRVEEGENVYPMVSPGCGLHDMVGVEP